MVTGTSRLFVLSILLATALAVLPRTQGNAWAEASAQATPGLESVLPSSDPPHPEIQQLRRELEGILTSTGNRQGRWAVLAVSLDRHDTILAMNHDQLMVPASNMKLLSTAAALHYLGPDFLYRTFLLADGPQAGEVLEGDLILYGTGDPTFSERFFRSETAAMDTLASKVLGMGIRQIRGDLVVDGSGPPTDATGRPIHLPRG